MAIVTSVDATLITSIDISVNFDDQTKEEKTYHIEDEISIDYIKDRLLVSIHGKLKDILPNTGGTGTILIIDASGEFETNVVNVNVNNIRKLNDIVVPSLE